MLMLPAFALLSCVQTPQPPLAAATTRAEWNSARRRLVGAWQKLLGDPGMRSPAPALETIAEEQVGGVIRRRVRYRVEQDRWTEAYLLMPAQRHGRLPGVVVFHSTVDYNIRQPAGLEGPEAMHIGLRLAERGFVAICPRCFIYDAGPRGFDKAVSDLSERHPRWTGMGRMLWDGQRALDVLAGMKEVDARRLGAIGHSLGAKEALYLAAFDARVQAAVSSEGGIGVSFSNWEAPWYLGSHAKQPDFGHDHHELLALGAPRPFLLIGGGSADGEPSRPYVEAARPIYGVYGRADGLKLFLHTAGHAFPPETQVEAYGWLEKRLIKSPAGKGRR